MDAEILEKLREPFPPEVIGKLPKVSCRECTNAHKAGKETCPKHKKVRCDVCGNYLTDAHIHLDFVGHAEVRDRLMSVDPGWKLEPLALDEQGLPVIKESLSGNEWVLWVKLTVAGETKIGVGSVTKDVNDIEKQLTGDALRNVARDFGVAIDLWKKSETGEVSHGIAVQGTPVMITVADDAGTDGTGPSENEGGESATQGQPALVVVDPGQGTPGLAGPVAGVPVVFEDEPLPEYHGADEDEDGLTARGSEVTAKTTAVEHSDEANKTKSDSVSQGSVAPVMETQKNAIKGLFDTLGVAKDQRAAYVSSVVGREVSALSELSRTEASNVLKALMQEGESQIATAHEGDDASGF